MKEFKEFLLKQNALALAIGVIIGAGIGKLVASLVADILMPFISLALPGGSWREAQVVLTRSVDATGKEVVNAVKLGSFFGSMIDFVIIALVIWILTKLFLAPPAVKVCPECLESVPLGAKRCRACTSTLA